MSNEKEIIKKLIKIANNQQKIINKLAQQSNAGATIDLATVKAKIIEHLILKKIPAHNAQEFVNKKLDSLNLGQVNGKQLLSGSFATEAGSETLERLVKQSIENACKELGIQCGVIVSLFNVPKPK